MNKLATADKFEDVAWVLQDPIINFSQHVVDQSIEENCRFQAKAGLSPKITRRLSGRACKWCINLAGFYDYFDKPDDIYRRHENCRCTVEYYPGDGRKAQNSHTKKWREIKNNAKMELRKSLNKEQQIVPNKIITGHDNSPKKFEPSSIIDKVDQFNKVLIRTFYDDSGHKELEIHTTCSYVNKWHIFF